LVGGPVGENTFKFHIRLALPSYRSIKVGRLNFDSEKVKNITVES
jgi:hypothetical protein